MIIEGGLTRQFSSNFKLTFYQCTDIALSCHWPADDCIVYYRTGGVREHNFIVYDFYAVAARLTVHEKI